MNRRALTFLLTGFFWLAIPEISFSASNGSETSHGSDTAFSRGLAVAVTYSSDKSFYGRRNPDRILYFSPSIMYEAPSGFFTGFASYRLIKPEKRWDEFHAIAGWDFRVFKKLMVSASYSRFSYSDSSVQLQSTLKNNVELMVAPETKFLQPRIYSALYFGNSSPDYFLMLELGHTFEWDSVFRSDAAIFLRPSMNFSAGTLHYYRLALRDRRLSETQRMLLAQEETQFKFSGIDFLLPFEYSIGRFIFEASVNYNIPLNQPLYMNAEPGFYFTTGLGFWIL